MDGNEQRVDSGEKPKKIDLAGLKDGLIRVRNRGEGTLFYSWSSRGIPIRDMEPEVDKRITVRRNVLNADGLTVDPESVRQGDLLVVEWTIENPEGLENLVIEDLLPAGWEIENARLKTSQNLPWAKKSSNLPVLHREMRDDRMLVFPKGFNGKRKFLYAVRAVTPGDYVLPAIKASCMYDPTVKSVFGKGRVEVVREES